MNKRKLCKDCKWYKKDWLEHLFGSGDRYDRCINPLLSENLVTGVNSNHNYCYTMRKYETFYCTKEGRYWEEKQLTSKNVKRYMGKNRNKSVCFNWITLGRHYLLFVCR